ncbi:MAG: SDR family oxidoreductase [Rhodobacteraceae bacterium]|nr:SDR family oxidoreductase [Paracoccaceae bacterium]
MGGTQADSKTMMCFGLGYSAQALVPLLVADGSWTVLGTSRTGGLAGGIDCLKWPGSDLRRYLDAATHLLISISPTEEGDPVLGALEEEISARCNQFRWVGYLSTTAVYGDHGSGWVDEGTPLTPATQRGLLRVKAEKAWQALDLPLHIFRLAGIYGPGRGPFAKIRNGTARRIIKPNQLFSRIHVDDIAQVLLASIQSPNQGQVYNVCDNLAAPPEDVISFAAELLGLPVPATEEFDTAEMTPMARSFYSESKRVRNDRIKSELGVKLLFPDYRAGLQALVTATPNPKEKGTA